MAKRPLKIFISYARSDKVKVRRLYKRLTRDGVDVWIDSENILPGQDWELEIRKAIRKRYAIVICLSKKFNKTGYRQKEVRFALDIALQQPEGKIFIIPLRLEKCNSLESLSKWNWVDLYKVGGYENLIHALRQRAREIGVTLPRPRAKRKIVISRPAQPKKKRKRKPESKKNTEDIKTRDSSRKTKDKTTIVNTLKNEKFVPDHVMQSWLDKHGLAENPFGKADFKSHPYYPDGATRPNQWEAFLDPYPFYGFCKNSDDAHVLSHRLRLECLPLNKKDKVSGVDLHNFPIWTSHRQTAPIQLPLITLAQSTSQTWLNILPQNPNKLLELSPIYQKAILELLQWSFESANAIIDLLQRNGLMEDEVGLTLIRRIEKFEKDYSTSPVPKDELLLSWLSVRPLGMSETFLIIPGDNFIQDTPKWWFEKYIPLIPILFSRGIVTKIIASTRPPISLPFHETELSWSEGLDGWLNRSLQGQFDAAIALDQKANGVAIRFHELFGPGTTEKQITTKFISASRKSLARMLALGNRLLQYHCGKRGVSEKYLYVEDLETILSTA